MKERKRHAAQHCSEVQGQTLSEAALREDRSKEGPIHYRHHRESEDVVHNLRESSEPANANSAGSFSLDDHTSPMASHQRLEEASGERFRLNADKNNENPSPVLSPVYNVSLQVRAITFCWDVSNRGFSPVNAASVFPSENISHTGSKPVKNNASGPGGSFSRKLCPTTRYLFYFQEHRAFLTRRDIRGRW